jgi:hypothetical protein
MNNKIEPYEMATHFIMSEQANFTPRSTLYITTDRTPGTYDWGEDPKQKLIDQTPAGRSLRHHFTQSELTLGEIAVLQERAVHYVIANAHGDVEIVFTSGRARTPFYESVLHPLLKNDKVDRINGLNRLKLYELYCGDKTEAKETSLNTITASLKAREITNGGDDSSVTEPLEIRIIREEVRKLVKEKLTGPLKDWQLAQVTNQQVLERYRLHEAEEKTLGFRRFLPFQRIRLSIRSQRLNSQVRKATEGEAIAHFKVMKISNELIKGDLRNELDYQVRQRGFELRDSLEKYKRETSLKVITESEIKDLRLEHSIYTIQNGAVKKYRHSL